MANLKVISWAIRNVGSVKSLAVINGDNFTVITGPSLWGCGIWGPFPTSAIKSTRDLVASDYWGVSGCVDEIWTPADLLKSLEREEGPGDLSNSLRIAIIDTKEG